MSVYTSGGRDTSLIRFVLSTIYEDEGIKGMDELEFGELLEGRDLVGVESLPTVTARIDAILPELMAGVVGTPAEGDLSVFLVGQDDKTKDPHAIYWCKSTTWLGRQYPMGVKALRTLPPECTIERDYKGKLAKEVDRILDDQETPPIARIKNAISHLAKQQHVVSVNGQWVVRSLKRGFVPL
jgi:hypothetical protein